MKSKTNRIVGTGRQFVFQAHLPHRGKYQFGGMPVMLVIFPADTMITIDRLFQNPWEQGEYHENTVCSDDARPSAAFWKGNPIMWLSLKMPT
jgi:hypothetical protein